MVLRLKGKFAVATHGDYTVSYHKTLVTAMKESRRLANIGMRPFVYILTDISVTPKRYREDRLRF